jgi:hypothetical protein
MPTNDGFYVTATNYTDPQIGGFIIIGTYFPTVLAGNGQSPSCVGFGTYLSPYPIDITAEDHVGIALSRIVLQLYTGWDPLGAEFAGAGLSPSTVGLGDYTGT